MGAVDPREPNVVVHHELPGLRRVVGPSTVKLPVVVSVPGDTRGIDDGPVRHISEEPIRIIFQVGWLHHRRGQPQPVWIGAHSIAFLDRVATAEGSPATAVDELAANVEVLVDHEDSRPQVARPDGSVKAHAAGPKDEDVDFIVPVNGLGVCDTCPGNNSRTSGRATCKKIAPANGLIVRPRNVLSSFVFVPHRFLPWCATRIVVGLADPGRA